MEISWVQGLVDWLTSALTSEIFSPLFSIFQLFWGYIVSGAAALIGWLFWRKTSKRNLFKKVEYPRHTSDFYKYFSQVLAGAKTVVRNSGDGFTISNPESLRNANTLDMALCDALKRGVEVRRFQITASAPISWYSRLAAIKGAYPKKFRVFINPNSDGIGSFCIIDPGTRQTVFEQQTVSGLIIGRGTEPVNFSFVHGNQTQSDRATKLFDQAAMGEGSRELSEDDIWELQKAEWYRRLRKVKSDQTYVLADPEIIEALRNASDETPAYPSEKFKSDVYTNLDFSSNWHV